MKESVPLAFLVFGGVFGLLIGCYSAQLRRGSWRGRCPPPPTSACSHLRELHWWLKRGVCFCGKTKIVCWGKGREMRRRGGGERGGEGGRRSTPAHEWRCSEAQAVADAFTATAADAAAAVQGVPPPSSPPSSPAPSRSRLRRLGQWRFDAAWRAHGRRQAVGKGLLLTRGCRRTRTLRRWRRRPRRTRSPSSR